MSEREAKVYLALLRKGTANTTELQKSSGVLQNKIYEILRQLVGKGYCARRQVGKKRVFRAINPNSALKADIRRMQMKIEEVQDLSDVLYEIYTRAEKTQEPFEYIEVIRGGENIHHRYCELVRNAKKEIVGFARAPYAATTSAEGIAEQTRENDAFMARKGISRWIFRISSPEDFVILSILEKQIKKGFNFRFTDNLPLKMMIFDRHTLLLADQERLSSVSEFTMSIIQQETTVNGYISLFEFFWEQSIGFEEWKVKNRDLLK